MVVNTNNTVPQRFILQILDKKLVEEVVSEVQPEVEKEKVVTPNEENPKLEEVTVSRPTELPLNNKTDESASRKIDLIGMKVQEPKCKVL